MSKIGLAWINPLHSMNVEQKYRCQLAYFLQVKVEDEQVMMKICHSQSYHFCGDFATTSFLLRFLHLLLSLGQNMQVDVYIFIQHSLNEERVFQSKL